MALLRKLINRPGHVVSRSDLLKLTPGDGCDEHAVEVAIGRLRTALGDPRIVQTVVKRGYRLAYEPERSRPATWHTGATKTHAQWSQHPIAARVAAGGRPSGARMPRRYTSQVNTTQTT